MNPDTEHVAISARPSSSELAVLLGVESEQIREAVKALEFDGVEPMSPREAMAVATYFGKVAEIEPRDLALEALYQLDATGVEDVTSVSTKAQRLVDGVQADLENLDHEIEDASSNWSVARMPTIDRCILRLGLFELLNEPDLPAAVVLSEAVRLANTYSTDKSGPFVNGVLATLAKNHQR